MSSISPIKPLDITQNNNQACPVPTLSKLIGGQGINNGMLAAAGQVPWVDTSPDDKWIEVLYASVSMISSGGSANCQLFLCPESSRAIPNLPLPGGNGGGPIVNNVGINFIGTAIPLDLAPAFKGVPSNAGPFIIPPGFFLRGAEMSGVADAAGVVHLTYLWRYC